MNISHLIISCDARHSGVKCAGDVLRLCKSGAEEILLLLLLLLLHDLLVLRLLVVIACQTICHKFVRFLLGHKTPTAMKAAPLFLLIIIVEKKW